MDDVPATLADTDGGADQPDTVPPLQARLDDAAGRSSVTLRAAVSWLRGSRLGLVAMALAVGGGAGLGAVGFRWLIFVFTWVATGHQQFGQQGRVASLHLPFLGIWFLLLRGSADRHTPR